MSLPGAASMTTTSLASNSAMSNALSVMESIQKQQQQQLQLQQQQQQQAAVAAQAAALQAAALQAAALQAAASSSTANHHHPVGAVAQPGVLGLHQSLLAGNAFVQPQGGPLSLVQQQQLAAAAAAAAAATRGHGGGALVHHGAPLHQPQVAVAHHQLQGLHGNHHQHHHHPAVAAALHGRPQQHQLQLAQLAASQQVNPLNLLLATGATTPLGLAALQAQQNHPLMAQNAAAQLAAVQAQAVQAVQASQASAGNAAALAAAMAPTAGGLLLLPRGFHN